MGSQARLNALGRSDQAEDVIQRPELTDRTPSAQADVEAQELAAQIEAVLETLSVERRVAVRFHLSGYDRADIERALGWSEAKTRNLLYRGLADLRERLAARGIGWERPQADDPADPDRTMS